MSTKDNRIEAGGERIVSVNDYGATRRSWLPRLAGLTVIMAIAVVGTVHTIQRHLAHSRAEEAAEAEQEKAARKPEQPGRRRTFAATAPAAATATSAYGEVAVGVHCGDGSAAVPMLARDGTTILAPSGLPVRVCRSGQILMPPLPSPPSADNVSGPSAQPASAPMPAQAETPVTPAAKPPPIDRYGGELILSGPAAAPLPTAVASGDARALAVNAPSDEAPADPHGPLRAMLRGTASKAVQAGMLGNRHLILPEGRTIDCNLSLRIISDISGKAVCVLSSYVYGDSGAVVLAEPGSVATGDYVALSAAGQRRLFITWTRLKTSRGVVIDINSPASDALGTSGLDGYLDSRWADRIGAAVLLSTVQDAITYQTARASDGRNGNGAGAGGIAVFQQTTRSGKELAERILDSTINIRPTVYKHQGDRASITVARDLDFGSVYELHSQ